MLFLFFLDILSMIVIFEPLLNCERYGEVLFYKYYFFFVIYRFDSVFVVI